jgi:hypothetical protein
MASRKRKPLSHAAKMRLARAEHARAEKAVARAAARLADCRACDIGKLESELDKLSKAHGVEIKYSESGKNESKKRGKKKTSKKKASKKLSPAVRKYLGIGQKRGKKASKKK